MRRRYPSTAFRILIGFLFITHACLATEWWRSTLYPADWQPPAGKQFMKDAMLQDFSYAGYQRGDVPVPLVTEPLFPVADYGADASGTTDATAAIQAAIDAAAEAGGGVVLLGEGTYKVAVPEGGSQALLIAHPKIVLRGAGTDKTFIFNTTTAMRSRAVITVRPPAGSNWRTATGPAVSITADLEGPALTIPVADAAPFSVDQWVVLRADATAAYIADLNMTDLWEGAHAASSLGGPLFYRRITGVDDSANTIDIDSPTRFILLTRDNARVVRTHDFLEEIGLEGFSIGNMQHPGTSGWEEQDYTDRDSGSYDTHASYLVKWQGVRNSWMHSVHSFQPEDNTKPVHMLSNGVQLLYARGITLQDVRMQRPQYGGGGGNGYMIRFSAAQECLALDCVVEWNRHGFVFSGMQTSGNVIHRGLARRTAWQAEGGRTNGRGSDHHMHLSQSNLIDNVTLDEDFFQAAWRGTWGTVPHGLSATHSVYWNLEGLRYLSGRPFIVESEQFAHGYVIGTRGPASEIRLPRSQGARTDPIDHREGVGEGDSLWPQSLYQDQRARRLGEHDPGPPQTNVSAPSSVPFPDRRARLEAGGNAEDDPEVSISWQQLSGPRNAFLTTPDSASTWAVVDLPGSYAFKVTLSRGSWTTARTVTVDFLPYATADVTLEASAATYVRDGSHADTSYGASGSLEVKTDGQGYTRHSLLRFPTAGIPRPVVSASLRMTPVNQGLPSMEHFVDRIPSDTWQEASVTWNTQPSVAGNAGTVEVLDGEQWELDVTAAVNATTGDTAFRISAAPNYGSNGWMQYAGRTVADPDQRPLLNLRTTDGEGEPQSSWATAPVLKVKPLRGGLRLQWPQDVRVSTIPYSIEWNHSLDPERWRPVSSEYQFADPSGSGNLRLLEIRLTPPPPMARFFRLKAEP
ncbi:MAG: DNRLRE domain-containing protein [Oceanipulchritudo sp.]